LAVTLVMLDATNHKYFYRPRGIVAGSDFWLSCYGTPRGATTDDAGGEVMSTSLVFRRGNANAQFAHLTTLANTLWF
jgi:hypothetical protein